MVWIAKQRHQSNRFLNILIQILLTNSAIKKCYFCNKLFKNGF
jgi:hypothetical protein